MLSYFDSRTAQRHANIIAATLLDLGRDLYVGLTPYPNGEVEAELKTGTRLRLKWDVQNQRLAQVHVAQPTLIAELAA